MCLKSSEVVSGVSNVLPKQDDTLKKLAEHEKAREQAEKDAKAAEGPTDEESMQTIFLIHHFSSRKMSVSLNLLWWRHINSIETGLSA